MKVKRVAKTEKRGRVDRAWSPINVWLSKDEIRAMEAALRIVGTNVAIFRGHSSDSQGHAV